GPFWIIGKNSVMALIVAQKIFAAVLTAGRSLQPRNFQDRRKNIDEGRQPGKPSVQAVCIHHDERHFNFSIIGIRSGAQVSFLLEKVATVVAEHKQHGVFEKADASQAPYDFVDERINVADRSVIKVSKVLDLVVRQRKTTFFKFRWEHVRKQ